MSHQFLLTSETYEFAGHASPDQDDDHDDQDDGNADSKADPLLFARCAGTCNATVELHVSLLQVLMCVHGPLLYVLHHRLLLHDDRI